MTEDELRTDYWVDNRSDRTFPLWVIFRQIGREAGKADGLPYTRQTGVDLPTMLKRLEQVEQIPALAALVGVRTEELRAALWYLTWAVESSPVPEAWAEWNRRLDTAWETGVLKPGEP